MKLDFCNGVDFVNIILYYRFVSFLHKTLYFTTFHENTISVFLVSRVLLLVLLIVLLIQSFTSTFQVKNVYAPTFLVYCTSYLHFTNFIHSCSHTRFVLYNHSFLSQLTVDSAKQKHYSNIDPLFFAFFNSLLFHSHYALLEDLCPFAAPSFPPYTPVVHPHEASLKLKTPRSDSWSSQITCWG